MCVCLCLQTSVACLAAHLIYLKRQRQPFPSISIFNFQFGLEICTNRSSLCLLQGLYGFVLCVLCGLTVNLCTHVEIIFNRSALRSCSNARCACSFLNSDSHLVCVCVYFLSHCNVQRILTSTIGLSQHQTAILQSNCMQIHIYIFCAHHMEVNSHLFMRSFCCLFRFTFSVHQVQIVVGLGNSRAINRRIYAP